MDVACDTTGLKERQSELEKTLGELNVQLKQLIERNSRYAIDQEEYNATYQGLADRYEAMRVEYEEVKKDIEQKRWKKEVLKAFIDSMEKTSEVITEFDEALWCGTVHEVVVSNKGMKFVFKNGMEVKE